jgi:hypothetical protein
MGCIGWGIIKSEVVTRGLTLLHLAVQTTRLHTDVSCADLLFFFYQLHVKLIRLWMVFLRGFVVEVETDGVVLAVQRKILSKMFIRWLFALEWAFEIRTLIFLVQRVLTHWWLFLLALTTHLLLLMQFFTHLSYLLLYGHLLLLGRSLVAGGTMPL